MASHFPLMIPGAAGTGRNTQVVAPYDGAAIATVELAGEADAEQALSNAQQAFADRDNWLSVPQRIDILERTADIMGQRADELAVAAAQEGGKPLMDSKVEVARAIDGVKVCIEHLRTQHGTEIPMGINAASIGRKAWTSFEPIGPVLAFSAFNHPLNLIVHQVAPAVATGCPCIVKPAGDTPLSCMRFVQILREAGLPEAWVQPVMTENYDVANKLSGDGRIGFFTFIGSGRVGWMLRSQLAPGTRCALEHGGVAPVIVEPDADLADAIPLLTKGGFYHAGQVCVSVQRIFAHDSIAKNLAERIAEGARQLVVGDPTSAETEVGPLIRNEETDRIAEWVDEAVAGGAELICGGAKITDSTYQPTVLFNPPANAKVSTAEVFGPVVCVYPYADINAAIEEANSLRVAFQASVFTKNLDTAFHASERLAAAAVMINDHTAFRVDWMPFAGLKESGHGIGGIPHTMHDMQVEKMVVFRRS